MNGVLGLAVGALIMAALVHSIAQASKTPTGQRLRIGLATNATTVSATTWQTGHHAGASWLSSAMATGYTGGVLTIAFWLALPSGPTRTAIAATIAVVTWAVLVILILIALIRADHSARRLVSDKQCRWPPGPPWPSASPSHPSHNHHQPAPTPNIWEYHAAEAAKSNIILTPRGGNKRPRRTKVPRRPQR